MARDRSLDEFVGGTSDGDETAGDGDVGQGDAVDETAGQDAEPDADASAGDDDLDPETVEPAVTTYAYSPDGAACAACGSVVEKRWRDEAGLVCGECKAW